MYGLFRGMDFAENQILISTEVLKGKGLKTTPLSQKTPPDLLLLLVPSHLPRENNMTTNLPELK